MESAAEVIGRKAQSRLEIITRALQVECVEDCNGQWLQLAIETLRRNNISVTRFSSTVKTAL